MLGCSGWQVVQSQNNDLLTCEGEQVSFSRTVGSESQIGVPDLPDFAYEVWSDLEGGLARLPA